MQLNTEVGETWPRYADADHLDIGDDRLAVEHGGNASFNGIWVKPRQAVELEVRRSVNHAPHEGPLISAVTVGANLLIDDGEGVVFDLLTRLGQLLGDDVVHVQRPLLFCV
jgi:hypothetical protein